MTMHCIRCARVIFRYAPVEERGSGLCDSCGSVQAIAERARLSCGRGECLMGEVPYECLVAAATGDPPQPCPALAV